jgi:hypothetical protein
MRFERFALEARLPIMQAFGRNADPAAPPGRIPTLTVRANAPEPYPKPVTPKHHFGFADLLSDLNPLQYILVGTVFRAVTGEVVPEPLRDAGSLVFSTILGGPIGAAINLGELAVEKISGIDPEKIGHKLLGDIGIGGKTPGLSVVSTPHPAPILSGVGAANAWSHVQLAAYGVTTTPGGELARGSLRGSDVLNDLELEKIRSYAIVQYAATANAV